MKLRFILYLILVLSFWVRVSGQNETNIWYFGENSGLDFNSGLPIPLLDGALVTDEGCATIADEQGGLLFYTDGVTVYNRNHQVMSNGTGLKGDTSSTHSAIIVPKPGDENFYYIFTVDNQGQEDGLQYSEVDMTLDSGLGALANKNILLETPVTEKLTAIKSSSSNEFWVLSHKWESDEFIAFNVSSTGVNSTPITSAAGTYVGGAEDRASIGQIKFSPDGTKLAVARSNGISEVQLFDFDATSGLVSNPITLLDFPDNIEVYGVEFSPDSQLLYTSVIGIAIFQYNLSLATPSDVINSQFEITQLPRPYCSMQLAPDGKIYIAKNNRLNIDVINNPNELGDSCNYEFETINLAGKRSKAGLPPFIQSFFIIGFDYTNSCAGDSTLFSANISEPYESLSWDFGDGETSTQENPAHTYLNDGTYTVTLSVNTGGQTVIETQEIIIYQQPIANVASNIYVCDTNNDGFEIFDLTQVEIEIFNGQDTSLFDIDYFETLDDLTNNFKIANPTNYQNVSSFAQEEIFVMVFNTQNQECFATTSFFIQPFYSPNPATQIPTLSFCDDSSVGNDSDGQIVFDLSSREDFLYNGVPDTEIIISYFEDAALTIPITNTTSYINTNSQEVIYAYLVNQNNPVCSVTTSFSLEVYELPDVSTSITLSQCDDDTDGFSIFNLEEVVSELSINASDEIITFHESEQQAIDGTNPITTTISYESQSVSTDVVWARVENSNGCYRTSQVQLLVSTTQIPLDFTREFYECDDSINGMTNDGISAFDFSTVTSEIESLFPTGQQLVIAYYQTLNEALSEINPILNITNYRNEDSPNTQEIYVRVDSLLDNDCLGLGEHITLYVETVPVANPVIIETLCDEDGDGIASFDTSQIESELLQGQNDIVITYTDQNGTALPSPLPNPLVTGSQNIIATLTNSTSQDNDGACSDQTTLAFQVEAAAIANTVAVQRNCDDNDDGVFGFDTSTIENAVLNGQTGMTVSYTGESGDILPSPLPNPFITATQDITVRIENQLSSDCYDETIISFIVDQQPQALTIMDDFVCDDASNDGEATFILSLYNPEILGSQSSGVFEVLYFASAENAQDGIGQLPNAFVNTSNPQIIHARIQNSQNADCFATTSFQIGVYELPIANQIDDVNICDVDNDTFEILDLSSLNGSIINGQPNTIITYHSSTGDANLAQNALDTMIELDESTTQVYARLESSLSSDCYTTTSFSIRLREQPGIDLDSVYFICDENPISLSVNGSYDLYEWSTGEFSSDITISEPGNYSITVTNVYGDFECSETFQFQVLASGLPEILDIVVEDFTNNDNSISITVNGTGDYEFSLNFGNWQDESFFSNLEYQESYTVFIRDKNGCGLIAQEVFLLNAPTYFTPNGDGINDLWNIYNFDKETTGVIHIFDRYGKQLSSIRAGNQGWNGIYNGRELPSTDYWFRLEKESGEVRVGHFSLLR